MHSRPAARREVAGPTRARRAVNVQSEIMVIATIGVVAVKVAAMIRTMVIHGTKPIEAVLREAVLSGGEVNEATMNGLTAIEVEATAAATAHRDRIVLPNATVISITDASSIVRHAPREATTHEAADQQDRPVDRASNVDLTVHLPP